MASMFRPIPNNTTLTAYFDITANHTNYVTTFEAIRSQLEGAVNDKLCVITYFQASATLFFHSKKIVPISYDKHTILDFTPIEQ